MAQDNHRSLRLREVSTVVRGPLFPTVVRGPLPHSGTGSHLPHSGMESLRPHSGSGSPSSPQWYGVPFFFTVVRGPLVPTVTPSSPQWYEVLSSPQWYGVSSSPPWYGVPSSPQWYGGSPRTHSGPRSAIRYVVESLETAGDRQHSVSLIMLPQTHAPQLSRHSYR